MDAGVEEEYRGGRRGGVRSRMLALRRSLEVDAAVEEEYDGRFIVERSRSRRLDKSDNGVGRWSSRPRESKEERILSAPSRVGKGLSSVLQKAREWPRPFLLGIHRFSTIE